MSSQPYTRKLVTIQQITAITDIPGADLQKFTYKTNHL